MAWRRFLRRAKWDRARLEEIESYLQMETDENRAAGMPEREAAAAARRKLGNVLAIREEIYSMNTVPVLESLERDARHGLRLLRRSPLFTTVALLTLAIGIGANTAVFSIVDSVLLRPLRYPKAEEVVAIRQMAPGAAGLADVSDGLRLSPSMYFTYAEHNRTFQALGVWAADTASVTGVTEPEQVRLVEVTDGVLQSLGVPPAAGRWLSAADQVPGGPETVMLSYGYWQRRFGGERAAIGRNIRVDARLRQIVGVMPAGFRFANTDFDLIAPLAFHRDSLILAGFGYQGVGRLRPGATVTQADADLARLLPVWMDSWSNGPGTDPHIYETWRITPAIRSLQKDVVGNVRDVLWAVMGTIGLVMLIACANVTNLLLVRAEARQQELALRAALGAGTSQIVRGLLVESVMLGLMGGVLGVGLALLGLSLFRAIGPANLPRLAEISIHPAALAFTFAVSLLSGLLLGLIPALKYAGSRISTTLRSAGRTASVSRERHRARNMLAVSQVAMALVLLVRAGLMIRTFQALRSVQPGFTRAERIQLMRISIPPSLVPDSERVVRMQNEIVDKLSAIPGVKTVAFATEMPMEGFPSSWDAIQTEDKPTAGNEIPPLRLFQSISPGLFETTGTSLVAGRDFTWTDLYGRRPVAIVSENLARELWGSPAAAVGKRIGTTLARSSLHEVVGVVENVRENGVQEPPPPTVYWPSFGVDLYDPAHVDAARTVTFAIRTGQAGREGLLGQVNRAVWSVNASLPLASVRTMQEVYDLSLERTSFTLLMLGIASAMAMLLGIIGIYGVISYAVSQRRREIGIRVALGAAPAELKRMFVRYGLALAGTGVVIGLGAAAVLTRLMKSLLFGVTPLDPLTYAAVPLVLAAAALLASYLPARRAALVDPVEALKAE